MDEVTHTRFCVLGPVRAWHGGVELDVGSPQQRAVLAALVLAEGAHLTPERLADGVWGEARPRTAVATVRTYVYRLRRLFPAGTDNPIRLLSGGYALTAPAGSIDVVVFRELLSKARQARTAGDHAAALAMLDEGLALWSGAPVAGVPGPFASAQRAALEELRLAALGDRLAATVDLGRHAEAVAELSRLVAEHPLVERFRALLMVALYGAGRQAEALTVFTDTARLLREELGVDPAPSLQEIHRRILAADPDLARPVPPAGAAAPAGGSPATNARPAQLPADLPDFVGREAELRLLAERAASTGARPAPIVVIGGMAGIGKTTLAVHSGHRLAPAFPDGQLYVNLRGFGPDSTVVDPAEALALFLQALGVPPRERPDGLDGRAALYRSLLADRRMLILLDNARDEAQVRPLLPGATACLVMVTSRNQMAGLTATHGAYPLRLPLFDRAEARRFLSGRLDHDDAGGPVDEIVERCGRLPLALAVVAARAAHDPVLPLSAIAADLRAAHGGLDAFVGEDPATNARAIFSWSYRTLEPEQTRLFRLLALHPGPGFTVPAVASLVAGPVRRTRGLLGRLTRSHLLTEYAPGRFSRHDLLTAYADELCTVHDPAGERDEALHRLLDHHLQTAAAASRLYSANRLPIALPDPRPGVCVTDLRTPEEASDWFTAEYRVVAGLVDRAAATHRFDAYVWRLTWAVTQFLHGRGLWHELNVLNRIAMDAAKRLGDPVAEAVIHSGLGRAEANLGHLDQAVVHMRRSIELLSGTGDTGTLAEQHRMFSWVLERQGRYDLALDHAEKALRLHRRTGDPTRRATALNAVGWCHALLGQYADALTHCRQALTLLEELDEPSGQADTWDSLGLAHHHLAQYTEAIHAYGRALELFRAVGVPYAVAQTLVRLGDTQLAIGDVGGADASWREAVAILTELGHSDADAVREQHRRLTGH
ncbi:BTAD domain-containing putative transcriptional regulator [Actinomycetes bacterium KLBMP 9797]